MVCLNMCMDICVLVSFCLLITRSNSKTIECPGISVCLYAQLCMHRLGLAVGCHLFISCDTYTHTCIRIQTESERGAGGGGSGPCPFFQKENTCCCSSLSLDVLINTTKN